MSRMPSSIRAVITVCQDQSLDSLAAIADKIVENSKSYEIAAVGDSPAATSQGALTELATQMSKLMWEVAALRNEVQRGGRSRSRSSQSNRSRSSSRKRKTSDDPDWLCRFHYRFRRNATRCEQPCAWREKGTGN
ncbi:hypothetical protein HW555_011264 [Spodoptera exigua]|uniref:Uncharacterized protein n=1 Tax=Spodoptera exigua TaxID=7107 RepID=A0A835G9N6_SPOEX|nr:hypothetical protein HW555_011264 [Spodoptera exigua]